MPRSSDIARDIVQTPDGGYFMFGVFGIDNSLWMVRIDSLGDSLWAVRYLPSGCDWVDPNAVIMTADHGYAMACYMGDSAGDWAYVLKVDSACDSIWALRVRPPRRWAIANDIAATRDGGFMVVGFSGRDSGYWSEAYAVRLDGAGETLWTRSYSGSRNVEAYAVKQTEDGGFVIVGWTGELFDHDALVIRTDSLGHPLWTRTYGGRGDEGFNTIEFVLGGMVAAGWTTSYGVGGSDGWLVKLNEQGDTLWIVTHGGFADDAWEVSKTRDSGFVLYGQTFSYGAGASDMWLVKVDSLGAMEWQRTFGGTDWDYASKALQTADGGYVAAGMTMSFGESWGDAYVVKTDSSGRAAVREHAAPDRAAERASPRVETSCPLAGEQSVRYYLFRAGPMKLDLLDVAGRKREVIYQGHSSAGWHEVRLEAKLPSGTYFVRLEAGNAQAVAKLVVPASVTD